MPNKRISQSALIAAILFVFVEIAAAQPIQTDQLPEITEEPTSAPASIGLDACLAHFRPDPLKPDELLLVYNGNNSASHDLAVYYANARGVPKDRLFPVFTDKWKERISRSDFERLIRRLLRAHLEKTPYRQQIRCLVTFFGLPIGIGQQQLTARQKKLLEQWRQEFVTALDEFKQAIDDLEAVGKKPGSRPKGQKPKEKDYQLLLKRYVRVRTDAWQIVSQMPDTADNQKHRLLWADTIRKTEGVSAFIEQLKPKYETNDQRELAIRGLQQAKEAIHNTQAQINEILSRGLEDPAHQEAHELIRKTNGLVGLLALLHSDMERFRTEETQAALDSELMLLWWDYYPLQRWVLNPLNWRNRTDPKMHDRLPAAYWNQPVLMVSRIDAPSVQIARRMIDQAIAAERKGLTGKVYVDTRGLRIGDGYGTCDQNLRDLALKLWQNTDLIVRQNSQAALFGPGQCPQTMLYCGWYSPRRYVDAFDFVPGAVGFHVASFEAISLKEPNEQGWCKRMLEDGITATLGPVAEPYLQAFPLPTDFFGLLLTGRFTLVECYTYTLPFNSWMMMLLGDPLYRPFARNPQLSIAQVFQPTEIPPQFKALTKTN